MPTKTSSMPSLSFELTSLTSITFQSSCRLLSVPIPLEEDVDGLEFASASAPSSSPSFEEEGDSPSLLLDPSDVRPLNPPKRLLPP
jgi:hypothetical protein